MPVLDGRQVVTCRCIIIYNIIIIMSSLARHVAREISDDIRRDEEDTSEDYIILCGHDDWPRL